MSFTEEMEALRLLAERRLGEFFPGGGLEEAMRYSLLAGGKRVRPVARRRRRWTSAAAWRCSTPTP